MKNELSITELIQKLKNRDLSGKSLTGKERLCVVGYLKSRGETCASIGIFLGYSDRQIRRIYQEFRKANAHYFSKDFWREEIGSFIRTTENAKEFLTRSYHDSAHDISIRVPAAASLWKLSNETMITLGKLGCLPTQDIVIRDGLYLASANPPKEIKKIKWIPRTPDDLLIANVAEKIMTYMEREKLYEVMKKAHGEMLDPIKTKENAEALRKQLKDLGNDTQRSTPAGS